MSPFFSSAEIVVPRLGLPGRVLAIRDDDVEVEVMGRRVRMPLRELEGATRASAASRACSRLPCLRIWIANW